MNMRIITTIALKDLKEVRQNRAAWIPAIVVPLVFVLLLPLVGIVLPGSVSMPMEELFAADSPLTLMSNNVPALNDLFAGLNEKQIWVVFFTGILVAPFFLIMPLMFSSIIGADSFAGEKERKTLEALIYSPATDGELFTGKVIASVAPAILLAWLCFAVYCVVVNALGWSIMGRIWFPLPQWWPLMLWVTPAIAALSIALTVLVSSRVSTFMEAYQMSASLVLLVVGLIAGQLTGVLYLNVEVSLLIGLLIWIVDVVMIRLAVRSFSRSNLLAKL
jgi:ABC-2 type transport system permease protein